MLERKELKKQPGNGRTKKGRRQIEWEHAREKAQERQFSEKKDTRRRQRRIEDDADMDWRDLLMEEVDDALQGQ